MKCNKKYYVYYLIFNDTIFYIGKGTGNRMYEHVKIAKNNRKNRSSNPKLYNKISSLIKKDIDIKHEIIFESNNETECLNYEVVKIKEIGLKNLCNITSGGEGVSRKVSEETKIKISNSRKGQPSNFKGKKLSDESKLKMSNAHKNKKFTDEHRKNISNSLKNKKKSKEHIEKIKRSNIITRKNKRT